MKLICAESTFRQEPENFKRAVHPIAGCCQYRNLPSFGSMVATPDLRGSGSAASDPAELLVLAAARAGLWLPLLLLLAPLEDAYAQSAVYSLRAMEIMCAAITFDTPG